MAVPRRGTTQGTRVMAPCEVDEMIRSLLLSGAMALCGAMTLSAETLPGTEGENLLGQKVKIAESLKGKVGVLVIGYSRASGEITAAWDKRLNADFASNPGVIVYQVP